MTEPGLHALQEPGVTSAPASSHSVKHSPLSPSLRSSIPPPLRLCVSLKLGLTSIHTLAGTPGSVLQTEMLPN